jgi:hypothetical protein
MNNKKLLKLFNSKNINTLSKSDYILYNDIINKKIQLGGGSQVGYSIRPDLGELNGMSLYSGYETKSAPIYVDTLIDFVSENI